MTNRKITYREAARAALHKALSRDPRVFLMGEDVGRYGGAYAVSLGWPLIRHNPEVRASGEKPFALDSAEPREAFRDYAYNELRHRALTQQHPETAERLIQRAEQAVRQRWATYKQLAARGGDRARHVSRSSELL